MKKQSSARDVAAMIIDLSLNIGEPITNMKLQKLLYYSYSWYFVKKKGKEKLFKEPIEAWKYGPVVNDVYELYRDNLADVIGESIGGDISLLNTDAVEIIENVFRVYGDKTAIELMDLSHSEKPWRDSYVEGEERTVIDDKLIFSFFNDKLNRITADQK